MKRFILAVLVTVGAASCAEACPGRAARVAARRAHASVAVTSARTVTRAVVAAPLRAVARPFVGVGGCPAGTVCPSK